MNFLFILFAQDHRKKLFLFYEVFGNDYVYMKNNLVCEIDDVRKMKFRSMML